MSPLRVGVLCASARSAVLGLGVGSCELACDRQRRKGTRHRVAAGAVHAHRACVRGPGQRRDGQGGRAVQRTRHGHSRADRVRQEGIGGTDSGRAGGAARRRDRGRVPRGGAADLRSDAACGAAGELQGLRQVLHGRAPHPHGCSPDLHRCTAGARLHRCTGRPDRRQGRRAGRGQGRSGRRKHRRGARGSRRHARRQPDGHRGRTRRNRRVFAGRRGELYRDGGRAPRPAARLQPGPQAAAGRGPRAQYRWDGGLLAGAGADSRAARARDARGDSAGRQRDGGAQGTRTPGSSMRG